ncbi:MAG: hypothetical protein H8E17_06500 [Deltaproteobacteria bacterium]|nr:hypothetical protein [Deltaproteobacteria bacterium]
MKQKSIGNGPISKKVISALRKANNRKLIDISELREAKIHADNLDKSVITEKEMYDLDPLHAIYAYAQNKMSVIVEQIADLKALSKLTNAMERADDLYMPSGPPISPLTKSYFTSWGFFDLCVGINKETFGTVVIDVCKALKVDQSLITLFECLQNSRMGFYMHEGFSEKFVLLREFITGEKIMVVVPSGYSGEFGQIWFARVMPEPFPGLNFGYSVLLTTPYIISEMKNDNFVLSSEESWLSFFKRTLEKIKIKDVKRAYAYLMKFGINRHYWNEYVFEAYVNHKDDMILLAGFPDIASSRPHSEENRTRF